MARAWFGGTSNDYLFETINAFGSTIMALNTSPLVGTCWDSQTGGTQYTDLLDVNGAPITSLAISGAQLPAFQAPDGVMQVWVDLGGGRVLLVAWDQATVAAASATQAQTSATAAASSVAESRAQLTFSGKALRKVGVVLSPGGASGFDDGLVEGLNPVYCHENGQIAGVYVGYTTGATPVASIGLAMSDDGINWTKLGQTFAGSGHAGDPDQYGCTGPLLHWDDQSGSWHLFYIGLNAAGYEGGSPSLCVATSPTLYPVAPWTRHGQILAPSGLSTGPSAWRMSKVWHPTLVRAGNVWHIFINATGTTGESIGHATASALLGPWTWDDANSPVLSPVGDEFICGDPFVTKTPGGWRMDYYTANNTGNPYDSGSSAADWYTTTTDALFPLGWTPHDPTAVSRRTLNVGGAGSCDQRYAHKPCLYQMGGRTYHYYTAVAFDGTRQVALAVSESLGSTQIATETIGTGIPKSVGAAATIITTAVPGTVQVATTAWTPVANLPASGAPIIARAGDLIECTINYGAVGDTANDLRLDIAALNDSNTVLGRISTILSNGVDGMPGWATVNTGIAYRTHSATIQFVAQAAHMRALQPGQTIGQLALIPMVRTDAYTRSILVDNQDPVIFTVRNLSA